MKPGKYLIALFLVLAFVPPVNGKDISKYDRDLFGGWLDTDHDCQNTRHELLQERSSVKVIFSENKCRVMRGRWHDLYTDKTFLESNLVDIDHLVPLKYSWDLPLTLISVGFFCGDGEGWVGGNQVGR